jgi:hypothetical protein
MNRIFVKAVWGLAAGVALAYAHKAYAGHDGYYPVEVTAGSGSNVTLAGSIHDARFGGGTSDMIGCTLDPINNWVECYAYQDLGAANKNKSCGKYAVSTGHDMANAVAAINETSYLWIQCGGSGGSSIVGFVVWNYSDSL